MTAKTKEERVKKQELSKQSLKVKHREIYDMREAIRLMNGILSSELGYFRAKLRRQIETTLDDLTDFTKTDEWKRVSQLYTDIDEKCAVKDSSGNPKRSQSGQVVIAASMMEERKELIAEMELAEKEAIDQRNKVWKQYQESMDKEIEVKHFAKIPKSLFPANTPTEVIDWLWPIILEDE